MYRKEGDDELWVVRNPRESVLVRQVARPCAALVSTNLTWIKFMQLRLDRVLKGQFEASGSVNEILASSAFEEADIPKAIGYD